MASVACSRADQGDPSGVGLHDRRRRRTFLIGVHGPQVERLVRQEGRERITSGGSSRPRRASSASTPVVASSVSQPPSTRTRPAHLARGRRRPRQPRSPEAVTREDDPIGIAVAEQSHALGDRDGVALEDIEVVAAVLGRRVGQAVTAQVQSHEPSRATAPGEPAGLVPRSSPSDRARGSPRSQAPWGWRADRPNRGNGCGRRRHLRP